MYSGIPIMKSLCHRSLLLFCIIGSLHAQPVQWNSSAVQNCSFHRMQLQTLCNASSPITATRVRGSIKNAFKSCPTSQKCFLFAIQDNSNSQTASGFCMLGFSQPCSTNPANARQNCCPGSQQTSSVLSMLPQWTPAENNAQERNFSGMDEFGYRVMPGTFSSPDSFVIMSVYALANTAIPLPPFLLKTSAQMPIHMLLERIPSKPIEVFLKLWENPSPEFAQCSVRSRLQAQQTSGMQIFYFDKITYRWLSLPNTTISANRTRATAHIHPEIFTRNQLSLSVVALIGVPLNINPRDAYTVPPAIVWRPSINKQIPAPKNLQNCMFPTKLNSTEMRAASLQGMTLQSAPTTLLLDSPVTVFTLESVASEVQNELLSMSSESTIMGGGTRRRSLLQVQQASSSPPSATPGYYNTTTQTWLPLTNCTYNATEALHTCTIVSRSANSSQIVVVGLLVNSTVQQGYELMLEEKVKGLISASTPAPPPSQTPTPMDTAQVVGATVGSLIIVAFFLWLCCCCGRKVQCCPRNYFLPTHQAFSQEPVFMMSGVSPYEYMPLPEQKQLTMMNQNRQLDADIHTFLGKKP